MKAAAAPNAARPEPRLQPNEDHDGGNHRPQNRGARHGNRDPYRDRRHWQPPAEWRTSQVEASEVQSEGQRHGDDAPELDRMGGRAGRSTEARAVLDRDEVGVLVQAGNVVRQLGEINAEAELEKPNDRHDRNRRNEGSQHTVELGSITKTLGRQETHTSPGQDLEQRSIGAQQLRPWYVTHVQHCVAQEDRADQKTHHHPHGTTVRHR